MKDQNLINFALRIKEIRKSLGLSQKEFAQSIEIPNSSMSEFESGRTKPTFYFYFNVSKVHNVNLRYLFHGEGKMFENEGDSIRIEGGFIDDEIKDMIEKFQIPALRLSIMGEYNKFKKIFKPLIDEFDAEQNSLKEKIG
jgi:transcriptional regulator with XRE-family HTH domain